MLEKMVANFGTVSEYNYEQLSNMWHGLCEEIGLTDNRSMFMLEEYVTNNVGVVQHCNVYFYDSYINALEKLNILEYSDNTSVELYEINPVVYAEVLRKEYDSVGYSRYTHVALMHVDKFKLRKFWDTEAKFFHCYGMMDKH